MGSYATDETGKVTGWQLSSGQQVQLGFSAFGDILDYYSSLNATRKESFQYDFQAWQAQQNSAILGAEAEDIIKAGNENVNRVKEEGLRVRGEQRVSMGASGFDVSSKSYQNILSETDRQIENNAATIRENTMSAYANKKYQERMTQIQGELYKTASKITKKGTSAWGSAISAGAKFAALSYFGGE